MNRYLVALFAGIVFGLGLSISQMVDPNKVLGFLDIFGDWDPSLAFVMGGAVAVTLVTFRYILKQSKPLFGNRFDVPTSDAVDASLLSGAVIFGIGWGIAGYCPGPAIASLSFGTMEPALFVVAVIVGNVMATLWQRRKA